MYFFLVCILIVWDKAFFSQFFSLILKKKKMFLRFLLDTPNNTHNLPLITRNFSLSTSTLLIVTIQIAFSSNLLHTLSYFFFPLTFSITYIFLFLTTYLCYTAVNHHVLSVTGNFLSNTLTPFRVNTPTIPFFPSEFLITLSVSYLIISNVAFVI